MGQGPTLDLGPCLIEFNSVDLGPTYGDVIFRYTEETRPIYEDEYGVSQVDEIHVGMSCEVEVPMTRMTLAQLGEVIPAATIDGTGEEMTISSTVGSSLYASAQELVLKPLVGGVASADENWLTVLKAAPKVDLEITYNNEGQRVYKAMFKGFVDPATGDIWKIGAPAV